MTPVLPAFKPAARAEHYPAPRACSSSESQAEVPWCARRRMSQMSNAYLGDSM